MKPEIAVGFFGAYGAILSIVVVYQTLALQAVRQRAEAVEREYGRGHGIDDAGRRRQAAVGRILLEAAVLLVAVTVAFWLIASYSDAIAALVDPAEVPSWAFTYGIWGLRGLYLAVTAYYTADLLRVGVVRDNLPWMR